MVNVQHIEAVPGKADSHDASSIANLLQHGLLNGSFVQSREQSELKELVGYRKSQCQIS